MSYKTYTIDLKCGLCGTKTGEHVVSAEFGWTKATATTDTFGFVDIRCDSCILTHGAFKTLAEEFVQKTGNDWVAAEAFVKNFPMRSTFAVELKKKVDAIEAAKQKGDKIN